MAIGNPITLTSNVASKTISVIATAGQTLFTVTGGYRINQLAVFRNGVRLLDSRDYEARNGATVTLLSAATVGDALEFQVFDDFRVADAIVSAESDQTIQGNLTVAGILTATDLRPTDLSLRHLKATGISTFSDTTQSTSITTGALIISGGVGIAKSLFIGGDMSVAGTLTYEDVTNVETAGITTTGGLVVTGLGATFGSISTHFSNIEFGAAGVGGTITPLGHAEFVGVVTASSFSGDGSGLTGVASTDNINTSTLAQFTGQVGIADSIFHIGDTNTSIRFPAADTFTVEINGGEVLRVDSSGNTGINCTSGGGKLAILANASTYEGLELQTPSGDGSGEFHIGVHQKGSTAGRSIVFRRGGADGMDTESFRIAADGNLLIGLTASVGEGGTPADLNSTEVGRGYINLARDDTAAADHILFGKNGAIAASVGTDTTNTIVFKTGTTEAARFDASQRLLIGTTALINSSTASNFQIASDFGPRICIARNDTSTAADNLIGALDFYGNDSDGTYENCARILAEADADHTTDSKLTRLTFYTAGSDPDVPEERLRINSSGAIGVGGANFGSSGQVLTSNGSGSAVTWEDASGGISTQAGNASGIVTSMFLTDATDHKVTATGICTITTTQSGTEGQSHTIRVVNSGIATVGFSTYFLFPSGSAPSLPTADGAVSLISFTVHDSVGAGCTQLLAGVSVNFS